jgi:hypothetical protein
MKTKTIASILLLAFVAVSVAFAIRKITPPSSPNQSEATDSNEANGAAIPGGLDAQHPDPDSAKHPKGRSGYRGQTPFPKMEPSHRSLDWIKHPY